MLVVGTENKELLLLDHSGNSIKKSISLKSVPVFIDCVGQFDVEYRIYVACRDGKILFIKNGVVQDLIYKIESKPIGFIRFDK